MRNAGPMSREAIEAALERELARSRSGQRLLRVEAVEPLFARVRSVGEALPAGPGAHAPASDMTGLADYALRAAILASIGPGVHAVATNLSLHFIGEPPQSTLLAEARLLKLGKRLAVGEVAVRSEVQDGVVCHASGTYAIAQPG